MGEISSHLAPPVPAAQVTAHPLFRRLHLPEGTELLLEPMGFAPAAFYQKELHDAGIPLTAFMVTDLGKEYERLTKLGVGFPTKPTKAGPTTLAVLDDTCRNLIQLFQP